MSSSTRHGGFRHLFAALIGSIALLLGHGARGGETPPPRVGEGLFAFDAYLDYHRLTSALEELAKKYPSRARLLSMGKSVEGRELWVLELTNRTTGDPPSKPAVYIEGGIHGNEAGSVSTALYTAWRLAANPGKRRSRSIERIMTRNTIYVAPAVNPDAVHHYITEPHSQWRPRFNYRPHDADQDGKTDEDPYEDLDKDGEIGPMYRPSETGEWIRDGDRMRRPRPGEKGQRYTYVGREGIDNDGDGKFSEDPAGGVDLNRNFPVGFKLRRQWEGFRGPQAASEPETKAILRFVETHPNIGLFLDYHGNGRCMFFWLGPDPPEEDASIYETLAGRARKILGYPPRPLRHPGAGLTIAWAYGELGLFAFTVELESVRGNREIYFKDKWGGNVFIAIHPFQHPQLGPILIGNAHRKIPARNLHPSDIAWQASKNFDWVKAELQAMPRLVFRDPKIAPEGDGWTVTGKILNEGKLPTDSALAKKRKRAFSFTFRAEGATVGGDTELGSLSPGQSKAFRVRLKPEPGASTVTLMGNHPRGGTVNLAVKTPRNPTVPIRKAYRIEPGYATPDRAVPANNDFFKDGAPRKECGPAFPLAHREDTLKVAVILGEWRDHKHTIPAKVFEKAFFSIGEYDGTSPTGQPVYGSVREFFREMSYGKVDVTGKVFDWIEFPETREAFLKLGFGSPKIEESLTQAIRGREGKDALQGFNAFVFIWAGNSVNRVSVLWPMRLVNFGRRAERYGVPPGAAACKLAEFHLGEMVPIGVPCHEITHTFGVSDKYGLGATRNPVGPWCLVGKGTHGGPPSGRHRPFHVCAWCKTVMGWVKPVAIDPSKSQKLALRPILFGPREAYRILLKPDGSEYLLLENRRREGFFTDLPSPGLALFHVGPPKIGRGGKPIAPETTVRLLPAHGLPPATSSNVARPKTVAWPQAGKTELVVGEVRLSRIRLVDDVVHFEVGPAKMPPAGEDAPKEIFLPAFDRGEVKASFMLAVPDSFDGKTPLPLILDFHGAIHPSKRGGRITHRVWARFVKRVDCIVAGPNGRKTAWNQIRGEKDDIAYALAVLARIRREYKIDPDRIYLAGFSSGSDFLCSGGLQQKGPFAASWVICPGPPNVVGIKDGSLLKAKKHSFLFATGEEDYVRKEGAWRAFLTLDDAGSRTMYREVPKKAHKFFGVDEYVWQYGYLQLLAESRKEGEEGLDLLLGREAMKREDWLLASTHLLRVKGEGKAEAENRLA
ncbi:MAG: M14 family zinc carboxypeptidase, partial [Planctomycetota bacterium]